MYREFLLEHKITFEQNLKNGNYILFNREVKKNTIWSWIQKSRDHGLTSVEIYNTIKYEIPFGRLKEISIEDLDRFNIFNNTKYFYHKKLREHGLLATWKQGEKWEVRAINYPELGARTLTREAINKHLSLNTPVQHIIKKAPPRVSSDPTITEEEVLEYGLKTPSQKKMYKELRPYGVYVIFKDNKPDFFKVKIDDQILEVSAHRLRTVRQYLKQEPPNSVQFTIVTFLKCGVKTNKQRKNTARGKYKPKTLKFEFVCIECNTVDVSADPKTLYCTKCKQERICNCGCGRVVKTPGKKYAPGCIIRGKTYTEIYGSKAVKCGYQTGDLNVAKRPLIRDKISKGVRLSYTPELRNRRRQFILDNGVGFNSSYNYRNSVNQRFRSSWEVAFSEFCIGNKISYAYEVPLPLTDGSLKIVDFIVNGIYVEVSGFALPEWQTSFVKKLNVFGNSTTAPIMVLVDKSKVNILKTQLDDPGRFVILDRKDYTTIKHIFQTI